MKKERELRNTHEVHSPEASENYRMIYLALYLTTTLLKAYLQQFLLHSI